MFSPQYDQFRVRHIALCQRNEDLEHKIQTKFIAHNNSDDLALSADVTSVQAITLKI